MNEKENFDKKNGTTEELTVKVCCPQCAEESDFVQFRKIDINKNPELREKIFSREIFKFKCPECGEEILVLYSCVYFDDENKHIICLDADASSSDETAAKLKIDGFSLRIVKTINGFIEKIAMVEDGVDDRVIELYKLLFEEQFEQQMPNSELISVFYAGRNTNDDKLHFYFITTEGENCETTLTLETYRNLYEHFLSTKFAKDDFSEIGTEWALDALAGGVLDIN